MVAKLGFALSVAVCLLMGTAAAQSMAFAGAGGPFPSFPNFPSFDINQFMPKDPCSCPADKFCPLGGSSAADCLPRTCSNWVKHNCKATGALKAIDCSQALAEAAGRMSTSATFDACFKSSKDDILCMQGPGALAVDCSNAGGGQSVNTWNAGSGGTASSSSSVGGGSGSTFVSTTNGDGTTTTSTSSRGSGTSTSSTSSDPVAAGSSSSSSPVAVDPVEAGSASSDPAAGAATPTTQQVPVGSGTAAQVQGGAAPGQVIPVVTQQQKVTGSAGAAGVARTLVMALAGAAVVVVAL